MADPRLTPSVSSLRERMVGGEAETRGRWRRKRRGEGGAKCCRLRFWGEGVLGEEGLVGPGGLQAAPLGSPVTANDAALKERGGRGLAKKV